MEAKTQLGTWRLKVRFRRIIKIAVIEVPDEVPDEVQEMQAEFSEV